MSQQIDWPGIRAAAVAIGVREAARRAAADLPPDEQERFVFRVLKRSMRERWMEVHKQPAPTGNAKPVSSQVLKGSEAIQSSLQADNEATKIAWSKAGRRAAEHFAKLKPSVNTKRAIAAKNWHSVAAGTHGWREREGSEGFTLNVLNLGSLGVQVRQVGSE